MNLVTARRRLLAGLLVGAAAAWAPAPASAQPHLPPAGKVWHGLTSGASTSDFATRVGRRPAVWQHFVQWGKGFEHVFRLNAAARARPMLHISTAEHQNMPGVISPGQIADGRGDDYLLLLNRRIAAHGAPVYLRLFGEMNNCDLAYSSHDCDGSRRGRQHSPARFKQAWRRAYLIVRGGDVGRMNGRLRALGMRPVATAETRLPSARAAFVWAPMTGGSPMIAALAPEVFWPGRRWVDWVGTSFYSRYPNFHWLTPFYDRFAVRYDKPFAIAEWAMWGADDAGFARRLFSWVRGHRRVRMVQYNQGSVENGPFRLQRYPRATAVIRSELRRGRFVSGP